MVADSEPVAILLLRVWPVARRLREPLHCGAAGNATRLGRRSRTPCRSDTGWRVRMLTRPGPSNEPSVEEIRAGWTVDDRTIVVFVDPTCECAATGGWLAGTTLSKLCRPFAPFREWYCPCCLPHATAAPNILNFKFGREVRSVLRPQFFTELQGRFGNMFNVSRQRDISSGVSRENVGSTES